MGMPSAEGSTTSRSGRQSDSATVRRVAARLISPKARNSSETASAAARMPTSEQYSRSGRRPQSRTGPTFAIQPSKVRRNALPLSSLAFPKITVRRAVK